MANVSVFHAESTAPILQYLNTFRSYVVSKLAIFFLIYLSTFILFAIIRVVTGISIKRLGFMSLRHISFSPSADTSIFIRSIKLTLHRPTFSRPGWFGILINELEVKISLTALLKHKEKKKKNKKPSDPKKHSHLFIEEDEDGPIWAFAPSSLFLTRLIRLIFLNARFLEITLTNTNVVVKDHLSVNIGELTHKVDLRKSEKLRESSKIVGTLDRHKFKKGEAAVVSRFAVKDIVLTPLNDPSISNMTRDEFLSQTELLDFFHIEVKGIIDVHKLALKGLAVGVRIGTLNLHVDRIRHIFQGVKNCLNASKETSDSFPVRPTFSRDSNVSYSSLDNSSDNFFNNADENSINSDKEDSTNQEYTSKNISALARFGTILVRIVKEVSVKFEHLSIRHFSLDPPTSPEETSDLKMSCTVKDIMIDLRRLNSENPSFRLFFKDTDSAHQAIFSCNSVSIGLYHNNIQEEILYIPLISTISKTNIFSKTIKLVKKSSSDENSNNSLLRTNINISTPSFNLKAHHFPVIIHGLSKKSKSKSHSKSRGFDYTNSTFQKLWPRAVIKFAIDEPAARIIVIPPKRQSTVEPQPQALCADFSGMVVVSCSKIYCDFSSSHINDNGKQNYSLKSSLHSSALDVFYQSNTGCRYDLLASESFLLKIAAVLNPSLSLICTSDLAGLKVSALHDEVLDGLQEVAHNFIRPKPKSTKKKKKPFFVRQFPSWLSHFYFKISNINLVIGTEKTFDMEKMHHEVLGLDIGVNNFVIDYRSHLEEQKNLSLINPSDNFFTLNSENEFFNSSDLFNSFASSESYNKFSNSTDDRNLAITFEGIYGYKIINAKRDVNSLFLSIPRFSAAFFTTSDMISPHVKTNFILRNANISWDFHLQYLITLTIHVIRLIVPKHPIVFNVPQPEPQSHEHHHHHHHHGEILDIEQDIEQDKSNQKELFDIQVQTGIIRFKAKLPNDVNVMLETNSLNYRKSREYVDTATARVVRLYTDHPNIPNAWTRLFVLSDLLITFKEKISNLKKPYVVDDNEQILFELRSIRIHVTNHLRLYRVFDNIISSFKGVIILAKTAKTGKLEPGHAKMRNTMPNIPKIRVRAKGLFLGLEDDVFESKLGLIFRVGLREQRLRLEKEEQFEEKVKAVLSHSTHPSKPSPSTTVPISRPSFEAKTSVRHSSTQPIFHSPLKDEVGANPSSLNEKNPSPPPASPHVAPHRTGTMDSLKPGFKYHNPIKHLHSGSQTLPQVFMSRRRHKYMEETPNEILDESTFTSQSSVSIEAARKKLLENFSTSWIRAHRAAEANQKRAVREQVELSLGIDEVDPETLANERIIDYSPYPFLFFVFINNTDLLIRKPDFDELGLRDFLFDIGKGQPRDTQFSLLIPLYLNLGASSLRVQIRDYPLPTVHFPELHPSQHRNITSVSIHGNFIIAENYSDKKANIRDIDIPLIAEAVGHTDDAEFHQYVARVKRTVASIKTFTSLQVHGRSHFPTRISHCQAYQPGMQASMQVFDTFSKPPIDPSEKMGFWDKIRLVLHARLQFHWKESDVHFMLKGSRNPYQLLGSSAGFVMVWRNNVVLSINQDDDPKRLFSLSSDDYLLAVPNFSLQEREYLSKYITVQNGLVCPTNFNESTTFQKVVMKLSGQVCWYMGMMFEREIERGTNLGRTFQFRPHYEVTLSKPEYIEDISSYDAYRGFRSDYIHLAISVISPSHTEYNSDDGESVSSSYNSVHLSPKAFAHFHKWWELFDSASSLPVRIGKMFNYDGPIQKSKKLGRHLYTVKYQLLLSPLFITHAYLTSDYDSKTNSYSHHSTGLKGKIDHFTLDLHQRRSPNPGEELSTGKRWRMHLNVGELDFINTDLRVIQATFKEKSHQQSLAKKFGFSVSPGSSISNGYSHSSSSGHYTGKIKISDNDYSWIDMDDFDELGETSPATIFPKITVSPMLYSPRWSYFRQTDHDDPRKYGTFIPFGSENSHDCVIGNRPPEDSHKIIINSRLSELEENLKTNETMLDSLKSDLERFPGVKATSDRIKKVQIDVTNLKERIAKVREIAVERFQVEDEIDTTARNVAKNVELARKLYDDKSAQGLGQATVQPQSPSSGPLPEPYLGNEDDNINIDTLEVPSVFEDGLSEFGIQVTRTITDCESVSSEPEFDQQRIEEPSTRRSTVVPPTRRESLFVPVDTHASAASSVHELHDLTSIGSANSLEPLDTIANARGDSVFTNRFIIHSMQLKWNNEIRNSVSHYFARVSERKKHAYYITRRAVKYLEDLAEKHSLNHPADSSGEIFAEDIGDILKELKSEFPGCDPHFNNMLDDMEGHLSAFDASLATTEGSFDAEEKYLIRLTSPQIQLVSDVNPDSAVLVTSENIQLKVIEIVDTERELGDQSRVLESRYGVFLQDAQFYVLSAENVKNHAYLYFSHNTYGCGKSAMWPPWLAVECCYDDQALQEFLVINKTSATLRYDKPNSLRIQESTNTEELQNTCTAALIRHEIHHQNRIAVDFPKIVATTDSHQFFAAYTIVIDLILYSEPVKKQHSEQLDKVLLTTDFNDLKKAINQVRDLQTKIRKFDDIRMEYITRMSELDESAIRDLAKVELIQDNLSFELGVIVVAIKTGMQKGSRDEDSSQFFKWAIGANQIIWHVLDSKHRPFMDVGLADASFNRIENTDGFNANSVEVGVMQAFNLESEAVYPEIFSPYVPNNGKFDSAKGKLMSINWTMLDPIGGIPIMQKFEVALRPLKLQFERNTWDKIFSFVFPVNKDGTRDDRPIFPSRNKKEISSPGSPTIYEHFSDSDSSEDDDDDDDDSISDTASGPGLGGSFLKKVGSIKLDSESDTNSVRHKRIHTLNPFQQSRLSNLASSATSIRSASNKAPSPGTHSPEHKRSPIGTAVTTNGTDSNTTCKLMANVDTPKDDDVALMMKRASNYMAIVQIKFVETTVCVSYKGQGSRNLLDIHEFVLNLPEISYQNKTWSNMDLVLHLKKDITKILLNHSGSLLGNKIKKHHQTRKKGQQLHQISDYVSFISVDDLANTETGRSIKKGVPKLSMISESEGSSLPMKNGNQTDSISLTGIDSPDESGNKGRLSRQPSTSSTPSHTSSVLNHVLHPHSAKSTNNNNDGDDDKSTGKKRRMLKRFLNS